MTPRHGRIAVTLGSSRPAPLQLAAIADIARGHGIDIAGVFIEDTDLFRAAKLPVAFELCRSTNTMRSLAAADVEREIGERARRARRILSEQADKRGLKWTFETIRQVEFKAVVEMTQKADIVAIPGGQVPVAGQSFSRRSATGEAARSKDHKKVVAVCDRSSAGRRAFRFGARLARDQQAHLIVLLIGQTRPGIERLATEIRASMATQAFDIHKLYRPDLSELVTLVRDHKPRALVVSRDWLAAESERLDATQQIPDCLTLIVS